MKTLINPTDDELNAAFAEHVAGWKPGEWLSLTSQPHSIQRDYIGPGYNYCRSMDGVLPWLEKCQHFDHNWNQVTKHHWIWIKRADRNKVDAHDKSLPRAAVIALLRANGIEVKFTS